MVFVYRTGSRGLADPLAVDVESAAGTESAVAANAHAPYGVCRGSNGGFPSLSSRCLPIHLRAFTGRTLFRAPAVGTRSSCGKPGRRALCASTHWHAPLSTGSHSLPTRTTPRARWNAPRALFCPYCRLSRVSHTHTMSRAWHLHQKASAADARCCIHCPNRRTKRVHRPRRCIRIILLLTRLFPIRSSGATGHARSPAAPGSSGNDVTRFS